MYVVKEMWQGRSARDQSIKEVGRKMWRSVNELAIVRYLNSFVPQYLFIIEGAHCYFFVDFFYENNP